MCLKTYLVKYWYEQNKKKSFIRKAYARPAHDLTESSILERIIQKRSFFEKVDHQGSTLWIYFMTK